MSLAVPAKSGGVAGAIAVAVLAVLIGLVIMLGVPITLALLIFPALGVAGAPLIGVTVLTVVAWWLVVALIQRLQR